MQKYIFIKVSSKLIKIKLSSIMYIEALADYITIHTEDNKYTILSTMKRIEGQLSDEYFFRVHNSYIVNLEHISVIENNNVIIGKTPIPISRNKFKQLTTLLNII